MASSSLPGVEAERQEPAFELGNDLAEIEIDEEVGYG